MESYDPGKSKTCLASEEGVRGYADPSLVPNKVEAIDGIIMYFL